jgi:Haem-dependent oxidative N-demethylase, alpha subunit-like
MSPDRGAPDALPFGDGVYRMAMGLIPIAACDWLEPGDVLADTLAAKRHLLETRHAEVFASLAEADAAADELLALVVVHLTEDHGALFRRDRDRLVNGATGESWDLANRALHPLDLAGRLVAEDLCLMQQHGARYILTGASLCSPARWRLAEKLGRPLVAIHAPVPGYHDALASAVDRLFAALRPGRIVGRFNWGIADDPTPFQPVAGPPAVLTAAEAGAKLWLRVERQTLRRMPRSGAVVFTIGTRITRLDAAIHSAEDAKALAATIATMPEETRAYKRIAPFEAPLLGWLAARG